MSGSKDPGIGPPVTPPAGGPRPCPPGEPPVPGEPTRYENGRGGADRSGGELLLALLRGSPPNDQRLVDPLLVG